MNGKAISTALAVHFLKYTTTGEHPFSARMKVSHNNFLDDNYNVYSCDYENIMKYCYDACFVEAP